MAQAQCRWRHIILTMMGMARAAREVRIARRRRRADPLLTIRAIARVGRPTGTFTSHAANTPTPAQSPPGPGNATDPAAKTPQITARPANASAFPGPGGDWAGVG